MGLVAILSPHFLLKLFKPDADPANALSALPGSLLNGSARCLAKYGFRINVGRCFWLSFKLQTLDKGLALPRRSVTVPAVPPEPEASDWVVPVFQNRLYC